MKTDSELLMERSELRLARHVALSRMHAIRDELTRRELQSFVDQERESMRQECGAVASVPAFRDWIKS